MTARKSIEYTIICTDAPRPYRKPVKGYPINLDVEGTYAVRKRSDFCYVIDHVETGFAVCSLEDREGAINLARQIVQKQGSAGFAKAIKRAHSLIKRRNIQ